MSRNMVTEFLSAARSPMEELENQRKYFSGLPLLKEVMDSMSDMSLILNRNRQIIIGNEALKSFTELGGCLSILGLRPGEAMRCVHADETLGGCGTTEFCKTCGAANAIFIGGNGEKNVRECRIIRKKGLGVLDLRVKVTPITHNKEEFMFVSIMDINHEKRRRALERIFFHDLLNVAGNIKGLFDILILDHPELSSEFAQRLDSNIQMLVNEIKAQKDLAAAESNELSINPVSINSIEIIDEIVDVYRSYRVARKRYLRIDDEAREIVFTSDKTLITRVLGNMVKNALEAAGKDEAVTVGCHLKGEGVEFRVHNPGSISREIQLQIFQRSFSTKSSDRGLGTYSMKLLCERYLGGSIAFESSPGEGTVFKAIFPLTLTVENETKERRQNDNLI